MGFLYRTEEPILSRFDSYCLERGLEGPEISRDFLSEWLERSPTGEAATTPNAWAWSGSS